MHSDIGDTLEEVPTFIWGLIGIVVELLLSHWMISAFETMVSGALAALLFFIILVGTIYASIADLLNLAGINIRG